VLLTASNLNTRVKKDRSECESGIAAACHRLIGETQIRDLALLKKACDLKVSAACSQKNSLEAARAQQENEAKKVAAVAQEKARKKNSKECRIAGLRKSFCENQVTARRLQRVIDFDKRVAAESGFVDRVKMNNNISARMLVEGQAKSTAAEISSLEGRSPASTECRVVDEGEFGAGYSAPLDEQAKQVCGD